jgi:hypothetical protein
MTGIRFITMSSRFLQVLSVGVLQASAFWAACVPIAYAQLEQPGLFPPLGILLAAASTASQPASGARTSSVTLPSQGRRIALVIGNGEYQYPDNLPKLANPAHDAEDIAKALRSFGFEVIERKNQTLEGMNQTIAEFGSKIGGSEAALFYFAGHGIQVKNQNYLMPINAKVESEAVVPYQGVNVNQILDEMDNGKSSANIVMLDACRNNPISGKFRSGKSRGLASPGSAPKGTVIVYATDPGNVAADGDGRNGLFTAGLLTAFKGSNLSLDEVLAVASAEVERASGQTQTPYVNGPKTLQRNFLFRATEDPSLGKIEKDYWNGIEHSSDRADFEAYLRKYPKGSYRDLADSQIRRIQAEQLAESKRFESQREGDRIAAERLATVKRESDRRAEEARQAAKKAVEQQEINRIAAAKKESERKEADKVSNLPVQEQLDKPIKLASLSPPVSGSPLPSMIGNGTVALPRFLKGKWSNLFGSNGVEVEITEAENGKLKGYVLTYYPRCNIRLPIKGSFDSEVLEFVSEGDNYCSGTTFRLRRQDGNSFSGQMMRADTTSQLVLNQISK